VYLGTRTATIDVKRVEQVLRQHFIDDFALGSDWRQHPAKVAQIWKEVDSSIRQTMPMSFYSTVAHPGQPKNMGGEIYHSKLDGTHVMVGSQREMYQRFL